MFFKPAEPYKEIKSCEALSYKSYYLSEIFTMSPYYKRLMENKNIMTTKTIQSKAQHEGVTRRGKLKLMQS